MKKLSRLLLSLSLIGLTGCTVTSYRQADTTPVPAERLYGHQDPLAEEALVRITRLSNYGGSACYFTVLIDDERAARVDTEEQAMFHPRRASTNSRSRATGMAADSVPRAKNGCATTARSAKWT